MKRLFTALALVCVSVVSFAKSVVFTLEDGSLVYYLLGGETNPVLRFVDGGITVNADNYTFSQVKNFYISNTDDPNAINDAKDGSGASYNGSTLVLGASEAKTAGLYDVSGVKVEADIEVKGDKAYISLDGLKPGTYVIRTGKSSFKFVKK